MTKSLMTTSKPLRFWWRSAKGSHCSPMWPPTREPSRSKRTCRTCCLVTCTEGLEKPSVGRKQGQVASVTKPGPNRLHISLMITKRYARNAFGGESTHSPSKAHTSSMHGPGSLMTVSQKLSQTSWPVTLSCEIHSMLGKALGDPCNWCGRRGAWKSSPPEAWKSFLSPGQRRDWLGKVNP